MCRGLRYKTLRWQWIEEIEPSYVVAIKSGEIVKGLTMAQITVRMHSKQVDLFTDLCVLYLTLLLSFRHVQFMIVLAV